MAVESLTDLPGYWLLRGLRASAYRSRRCWPEWFPHPAESLTGSPLNAASAGAARGSALHDIAWEHGDQGRSVFDQLRDVVDHIAGLGFLNGHSIVITVIWCRRSMGSP